MTDAEGTPHSLSPELLDQLATEFEQNWRNGGQPSIEDFLQRVEENSRPSLFRELLQVELELRQADGNSVSLKEYQDRFPSYADILKDLPALQQQPDPEPANIFEQIESIFRVFRRQLKHGASCQIEDYVTRVNGHAQSTLFEQLLSAEITYRLQHGERPSSDEYIARFPQFKRLIHRAFLEPSLMSSDSSDELPANIQTVITELPTGEQLGDYELLKELGRGGMGVVFEARHVKRNDRVALKTLPKYVDGQPHPLKDADRLHKFRREFRSLAEINHPHLIGMQTLEVDGDQWFFTMDLTNIADWTDEELWKAYIQLTEAEAAFRIHKSDLSIRPIWHQKEERVLAHILVCFLAYVLWKTLGQLCERAGLGNEPRRVLSELSEIRVMDVVLPTRQGVEIRKRCISKPSDHQEILLDRLGLHLPCTIKQIEM